MPFTSTTDESRVQRFTGRQITVIVVAVATAIVALPLGIYASAGSVATVQPAGRGQAEWTGRYAVTGGVPDAVTAQRPFAKTGNGQRAIVGPTTLPINVSSVTVSTDSAAGATVSLLAVQFSSSKTRCTTAGDLSNEPLWYLHTLPQSVPFAAVFPTPVQAPAPPAGEKQCLYFEDGGTGALTSYSVSGYLGS
jgi:hypothetical protein